MQRNVAIGEMEAFIRFDPRTKIYIVCVLNIIGINKADNLTGFALGVVTVGVSLALTINMKCYRAALVYTLIYLLVFSSEKLLGYISGMSIPGIIIRLLVPVILRMLPGVMAAWYLIRTTKVSELLAAFQKMRLPAVVTIPFAVMLRFFPTIGEVYRCIQDAMKMRGIGIRNGVLALVEYRLIPLMMSIVSIGSDLAAAAVTRGLGSQIRRTSYCRIGFRFIDVIMILFMSVLLLAGIAVRNMPLN